MAAQATSPLKERLLTNRGRVGCVTSLCGPSKEDLAKPNAIIPLEQVREALLNHISGTSIPNELLSVLAASFGSHTLQAALDIVDKRGVTFVVSPSGHRVARVAGSSGQMYTCLYQQHYCECKAFDFSLTKAGERLVGLQGLVADEHICMNQPLA